jgi:hypothetical protein
VRYELLKISVRYKVPSYLQIVRGRLPKRIGIEGINQGERDGKFRAIEG